MLALRLYFQNEQQSAETQHIAIDKYISNSDHNTKGYNAITQRTSIPEFVSLLRVGTRLYLVLNKASDETNEYTMSSNLIYSVTNSSKALRKSG